MSSSLTKQHEESVTYTYAFAVEQQHNIVFDPNFWCDIWEVTAHCDVQLLPSHCAVFSHGYFLQCLLKWTIIDGIHAMSAWILNLKRAK